MLYALGFVLLFTIGGFTGLMVATLGVDIHVHDTYFAHFHHVMVGTTVSAYFGALHYWWPKMTGRHYPEMWGAFRCNSHLRGIQSHLLPTIYYGLSRHAQTLVYVSA